MSEHVVTVSDLTVSDDTDPFNFSVTERFTLLEGARESGTTLLALALAGRFRPISGTITVGEDQGPVGPRALFHRVGLAGVPEIDSLDRHVRYSTFVRDHIAWSSPWYARSNPNSPQWRAYEHFAELIGFDTSTDPDTPVGGLHPAQRFRLRVLLALIDRPTADYLVVDDIDAVKSLALRDDLITSLVALAADIPVVALTANPAPAAVARIDLGGTR
ncbi:MAG: hypothetical protein SPI77_06630 [Corynebacterium sp.]|nr:hypothetical protein [Corynebacterium sp.]